MAAQTLPTGTSATDIGAPSLRGSASFSGGTFTVTGAGRDVWSSSDQFMFVHARLSGDMTIVARVSSVQNVDPWTKAGVMIRESLAAGSRNAFALVSPGKGAAYQRRTSTGGSTSSTVTSGVAPTWLRLQRVGSSITASRSSNGVQWTSIGTHTVSMASTVYVGLAVTSHDTSARATARFDSVSITKGTTSGGTAPPPSGTLPSGWGSSDIGGAPTGRAGYASGVFTLDGAGRDIWGTSDQFRFAYRQVSGDFDLIARVRSVERVDAWSKAGVMIRSSLSASSAHASMFVSASNGLAFQRRSTSGGTTVHTGGGSQAAPRWVGLTRRGSTIRAFQSADGVSWTAVGSQSLTLPSTFYVGLAVTSHSTSSSLATAVFDNVTVRTVSGSSNQPPAVSLTAPGAGASYTAPASVSIAATASDSDGTIARVDFYVGSTLIRSDTASPYTATWSATTTGTFAVTAVARDNDGATTRSSARTITVNGAGNSPPAVSLTSPANGASFTAPASITVSANASDSNGTIARVEFYAGTTLIGSADTTAPYSRTWSNVPAGTYSLTAVARDNGGATTVSSARSITVRAASMPTTAAFTPSSNHSTAVTRYVVEFFYAGANPSASNPVATDDIGKPSIVNGEIRADVSQTVLSLTPGSYIATVTAIGTGGSARSAPSPAFTR